MFALQRLPFAASNHLRIAGLLLVAGIVMSPARADECCEQPSWIFQPSTYTHAPENGARVAQYARHAYVEELPDPRLVTSGYRTTRTNIRTANGGLDSYYQVQSWGNGRGGIDAEWERFHDAWKESYLSGGYYNGYTGYGGYSGYGYGYGGYRYGGYGTGVYGDNGYRNYPENYGYRVYPQP